MTLLPAVACVACVIGLLVAEARRSAPLRAVAKTGASGAFLLFAWTAGVLDAGPAGIAVMVALVLSAIGDLALLGSARGPFLAGLVAFLLAHVGYVVAFALLGVAPLATGGALVVVAAAGALVWRWLGPHVGRMRGPVLAYMTVIGVMVAMAAGHLGADPGPRAAGLLASAVLFYLSDLCVARQRFVAKDVRNRYVGLPLYYAAQLGFVAFVGLSGAAVVTGSP